MNLINRVILYLDVRGIIRLPDEMFIRLAYENNFHKKFNIDNPQTFNEKLQWLKLNDKKEIYTTMVDKYKVKKYVSDIIGEKYIIPTLGVYEKFDDINFSKLPDQFVLKCTHDSGSSIVCEDKSELDIKKARKKINKNLKKNFYYSFREWPYKNVKPRIIVEKYMENIGESLKDYKFMCFNGKVKCIFVCSNRHTKTGLNIDIFDTDWVKMPFGRAKHPNSKDIIKRPENLEKMIDLSEKLAKDMPFIRVDFYESNNKIFFGELTFYPSAGFEKFEPEEYDKILGDMLELPKIKTGDKKQNEK